MSTENTACLFDPPGAQLAVHCSAQRRLPRSTTPCRIEQRRLSQDVHPSGPSLTHAFHVLQKGSLPKLWMRTNGDRVQQVAVQSGVWHNRPLPRKSLDQTPRMLNRHRDMSAYCPIPRSGSSDYPPSVQSIPHIN